MTKTFPLSAPTAPSSGDRPLLHPRQLAPIGRILPGLLLCIAVTGAASALSAFEATIFGQAWLETLVLAILLGTAVRTAWTPSGLWTQGIAFSAKFVLEIAVVLLGLSVSAATILSIGPALITGIVVVVAAAIAASFAIGRCLGLPKRLALLVACGNSICGNSAIAAVAPVIGADSRDVTASIAFTAVLGVVVVLGLPVLAVAAGMSGLQFGALAGLTVYSVPQVIAAAAPLGATAVQTATLVKLVRVLMLGPVCFVLALIAHRFDDERAPSGPANGKPSKLPPAHRLVPWFIIGFLALVVVRSFGVVPTVVVTPASHLATVLTIISMAALGLGVDVRIVARAGGRVTAAVILSLVALGGVSLGLIHLAGLA